MYLIFMYLYTNIPQVCVCVCLAGQKKCMNFMQQASI